MLFGIIICLIALYQLGKIIVYRTSDYYKGTHNSYYKVRHDKGCLGEYSLSKKLKPFAKDGAKFLYNCYLPTDQGKTTEIDLIMLHKTGIYVFENKNYGGYIYGSSDMPQWRQVFYNCRSSHTSEFYNPIMQNATHIRWLKKRLRREYPIHSVVTFGDQSNIAAIHFPGTDARVCKQRDVYNIVTDIQHRTRGKLTENEIDTIYTGLRPYTNATKSVKQRHIQQVSLHTR